MVWSYDDLWYGNGDMRLRNENIVRGNEHVLLGNGEIGENIGVVECYGFPVLRERKV